MKKGFFIKKEEVPPNFVQSLMDDILANDESKRIGGLTSFVGIVRSTSDKGEKAVIGMEVETWEEEGDDKLDQLTRELIDKTGVLDARLVHVYGNLQLGDPIVFLVIGSAHRKEAFMGLEPFIDAYKNKAPVWKKEVYGDGSSAWIRTAH